MNRIKDVFDSEKINKLLNQTKDSNNETIDRILKKALEKKGLDLLEVAYLLNIEDERLLDQIFKVAGEIKKDIYGERLVLFAPLYVSSFCVNDCKYCAFHVSNNSDRKKLSLTEVVSEVKALEAMGHKRLLLEFGEDPKNNTIDYVIETIKAIYNTKFKNGSIRRVNVNIAATTVENYQKLTAVGIGTYQLFQETYHEQTYKEIHSGPKANFERQLFAHDRAFEAGIDDLGLGVLFGLYDYKFEVMALISHAKYMERTFGVGPHTFSVPRLQPAESVNYKSKYPVSEKQLLKIIAILRLAVPYTGMIISTRERPEIRAKAFEIGISQTSAGSKTSPGGYSEEKVLEQFKKADERSIEEIIEDILKQNLLPSFCTACYRQGRTGKDFMDLAKPGEIHNFCRPNAILTFKEYLLDYAPKEIIELGEKIMNNYLDQIENKKIKAETIRKLKKLEEGARDLYF